MSEALRELDVAADFYAAAATTAHDIGDTHLEGESCGYQGLLWARLGRGAEAHEALDRGESLLALAADPASQGLLLCQRASAAALLGDRPAAQAALERAERLAKQLSPAADSELGQALQSARQQLRDGTA